MKGKVIVLVIACITFLGGNALQAQPKRGHGPRPLPDSCQIQRMVDDLAGELTLTDDQERTIHAMFVAHFEEVKAAFESGKPDRHAMEEMKRTFEKKVSALLTDEQQKRFEVLQEEHGPGSHRRERPRR